MQFKLASHCVWSLWGYLSHKLTSVLSSVVGSVCLQHWFLCHDVIMCFSYYNCMIEIIFMMSQCALYVYAWRQMYNNKQSWISNHQPHDCLLNRLFRRRSNKHQSSASLVFVRGIHRWPVNSSHKGSVMRKRFPFDDVITNNMADFFAPNRNKKAKGELCACHRWIPQWRRKCFPLMTSSWRLLTLTLTHLPLVPHMCFSESN